MVTGLRKRVGASVVFIATAMVLMAPSLALAFGPLSGFGIPGSGAGQVSMPIALEVDFEGSVYIADFNNNRIDVFASNGKFLRAFGKGVNPLGGNVCTTATGCQKGVGDGSAGALDRPAGIAINQFGWVYISSYGNARVDIYSMDGQFMGAFGKGVGLLGEDSCNMSGCQKGVADGSAGTLVTPAGVAIGSSGSVYVGDFGANRVSVFTSQGVFVRAFGKGVNPAGGDICTAATGCLKGQDAEAAGGMSFPDDVAIDGSGQIAVADYNNNRVDVFSPEATFVRSFGEGVNPAGGNVCTAATGCKKGTGSTAAGALAGPTSLGFTISGEVYVAEVTNNRVSQFASDATFVRAFGAGVADGVNAFQVCTASTTCRKGLGGTGLGNIVTPFGLGLDCQGAVYATSQGGTNDASVKRFGEPGTPPCGSSQPPDPSTTPSKASLLSPPAANPHEAAKPVLEIELNKGAGTATLTVIVSEPGTLLLKGKGILRVKRQAKRPGLYELVVTAVGKAKRKLFETGKAKVKLLLTFDPDVGSTSTQAKTVILQQAAHI